MTDPKAQRGETGGETDNTFDWGYMLGATDARIDEEEDVYFYVDKWTVYSLNPDEWKTYPEDPGW